MRSRTAGGLDKYFILAFSTLLVISTAAAVNWVEPDSSEYYRDTVDLRVSNDTVNSSLDFWVKPPGGSYNDNKIGNVGGSSGWWNTSYGKSDTDNGDFTFKVNSSNVSEEITGITMDTENGSASSFSPSDGGEISDKTPTVSFDASDDHSGVNYSSMWLFDSSGDREAFSNSSSLDVSNDLSEGDYDVTYLVVDNSGNARNESSNWTFTVDTTLNATLDPTWDPSGDTLEWDPDDDRINVSLDEINEDDLSWECRKGDNDTISDDDNMDTDDDEDPYCEGEELDGDVDLKLYVEDEAGNSDISEEESYTFDTAPPFWDEDPETSSGLDTFTSSFDVSLDGDDSDTSVEKVRYWFDEEDLDGGKTEVDFSDSIGLDVSGLSSGDHTAYFELVDEVNRSSATTRSLNFTYLPEADPQLDISGPESMEVTAGETGNLSAEVENTGKLKVEDFEVTASGPGASGSETVAKLLPNESVPLEFDVSPGEDQLGEGEITVSTDSPEASHTTQLTVRANENQSQRIQSELDSYRSTLDELEGNASELKSGGLSDSLRNRLEANLSEFRSTVQEAESAAEQGEYYRVQEILQGADSEAQNAENSVESVRETVKRNNRFRLLLILAGGLLIVGGGVAAYAYRSDRFDFDPSTLTNSDIGLNSLEGLKDRFEVLFTEEEEAEQFEWDGFQ